MVICTVTSLLPVKAVVNDSPIFQCQLLLWRVVAAYTDNVHTYKILELNQVLSIAGLLKHIEKKSAELN
jgi:hypothetical protein